MEFTAKAEYALRAATFLANAGPGPVKSEAIAVAEDIPLRFLHNILAALTRAGILSSLRGADGGYELTRAPARITAADVIRAVEGPSAAGGSPDAADAPVPRRGGNDALRAVSAVLRANERAVLESVTLVDLVSGRLPDLSAVGRFTTT